MTPLVELRPVYVAGAGLHRYQRPTETPYWELGLGAVTAALLDAGVPWTSVESAVTGTALLGMGASRPMLGQLGATGIGMTQVENASASGSSAFRVACIEIAAGLTDVALACGVDKAAPLRFAGDGSPCLVEGQVVPATHYALLADEYMARHGVTEAQLASVAVKNHANGALNHYAQRRQTRTLDDVLCSERVSGVLRRLHCCPVGEGAAAVVLVSDIGIDRWGLDRSRCVRVLSSVAGSEGPYGHHSYDGELTREVTGRALSDAGVHPNMLDVVEMHDAFAIEELVYVEAIGLCPPGAAASLIWDGDFDIGGSCAVSPSGGLIAMGHPIGPTGVGQIATLTMQLRGAAGESQQPGARLALAHMVGLGAVCVVHVLASPG